MPTYDNASEMENAINKLIHTSVEMTAIELMDKLKELLKSEYYNQYEPELYKRTYMLANSYAYKMIDSGVGMVYLDGNGKYKSGSRPLLSTVQENASQGFHGFPSQNIRTSGRFWESFLEYVNDNIINILKNNMKKNGLDIT